MQGLGDEMYNEIMLHMNKSYIETKAPISVF